MLSPHSWQLQLDASPGLWVLKSRFFAYQQQTHQNPKHNMYKIQGLFESKMVGQSHLFKVILFESQNFFQIEKGFYNYVGRINQNIKKISENVRLDLGFNTYYKATTAGFGVCVVCVCSVYLCVYAYVHMRKRFSSTMTRIQDLAYARQSLGNTFNLRSFNMYNNSQLTNIYFCLNLEPNTSEKLLVTNISNPFETNDVEPTD